MPTPLSAYTGGLSEIHLQGQTVAEALGDLIEQHPDLKPHLFTDRGDLRPFVSLFIGEESIHDLGGLDAPLKERDRLLIIPSIAGG